MPDLLDLVEFRGWIAAFFNGCSVFEQQLMKS
jgi:hypothetical protein